MLALNTAEDLSHAPSASTGLPKMIALSFYFLSFEFLQGMSGNEHVE
jgi:hypothetical protein